MFMLLFLGERYVVLLIVPTYTCHAHIVRDSHNRLYHTPPYIKFGHTRMEVVQVSGRSLLGFMDHDVTPCGFDFLESPPWMAVRLKCPDVSSQHRNLRYRWAVRRCSTNISRGSGYYEQLGRCASSWKRPMTCDAVCYM